MTSFFLRYLSIINTSRIIWEEPEWASALDPVESAESAASAASAAFTYYLRGIKDGQLSHHSHSKLQGWSYATLVHPMGGSHHHIGGSVGSHLPEIQQHIRCPMLMPPADACPWGAASQEWVVTDQDLDFDNH